MGALLTCCLKGIDELHLGTPYKPRRRQTLQTLLGDKSNPNVSGRKYSGPAPSPRGSTAGLRPPTQSRRKSSGAGQVPPELWKSPCPSPPEHGKYTCPPAAAGEFWGRPPVPDPRRKSYEPPRDTWLEQPPEAPRRKSFEPPRDFWKKPPDRPPTPKRRSLKIPNPFAGSGSAEKSGKRSKNKDTLREPAGLLESIRRSSLK